MSILPRHAEAKLVGCIDPEPSALDWAKANFPNLSCSQDLQEILGKTKADAVIISGVPWLRAAQTIKSLEAGLSVLTEFPFATSLADAVRVLDASRRTGKPLLVAAQTDASGVTILRRLLDKKKVGTVTHVSWIDRRSVSTEEKASVSYSQLVSVGVHHLGRLRQILGTDPMSLMARCSRSPWGHFQYGSTTEAFVKMKNSIHVQYHGSLGSRDEQTLWIEGDKGVLKAEKSRIWWRKLGWKFFLPLSPRKSSLDAPIQEPELLLSQLAAAVRGELRSRPPDEEN